MAYWDEGRGVWVDDNNPNVTYDPDEGIWRNVGENTYMNPATGQWLSSSGTTSGGTGAGAFQGDPGYGYELQAREYAFAKDREAAMSAARSGDIATQEAGANTRAAQQAAVNREEIAANRAIAEAENATRLKIAQQEAQLTRDITAINNAATAERQAADAALQRELQAGRISHEQYMQSKTLAQQESEFARQFALQERLAEHQIELENNNLELARIIEARNERELQSRLAANPQDFVQYEYYKRGLANQAQAQGQQAPGGASTPGAANTLSGTPYPSAPPAYSDATLQQLVANIAGGGQPLYNPNLGGTGAFGVNIQSPNQLSRAEASQLTDQEMGILTSFLRAGVETTPGGPRVALDPAEYFTQTQDSWIPTWEGAGSGMTRYQ